MHQERGRNLGCRYGLLDGQIHIPAHDKAGRNSGKDSLKSGQANCDALDITPYELLSNVKEEGTRANKVSYRIVVEGTEEDIFLDTYERLDVKARGRLLGYMEALQESAKCYHL